MSTHQANDAADTPASAGAEALFPWVEANSGLIGLLGTALGLIALIVPALSYFIFRPALKKQLADPQSWPLLRDRYRTHGAAGYFAALGRLNSWADGFYGKTLFGAQAFERSIILALVYPSIALLLAWLIFNAGEVGEVVFLPESFDFWQRLWRCGALFGVIAVLYFVSRNWQRVEDWLASKLQAFANRTEATIETHRRRGILTRAAPFLSFAVTFGLALLAGTMFARLAIIALDGVAVGIVAFAGTFVMAIAFYYSGLLTGLVTLAVVVVMSFVLLTPLVLTAYLLFFAILPFWNAVADYISVAATRWFLRRIEHDQPGILGLAVDLLLDLLVAAVCLTLLIAAITMTLDIADPLVPDGLVFDWRAYRDRLMGPGGWGDAALLISLLVTTLIPTALHIIAGIAGILSQHSARYRRVADALEAAIAAPEQSGFSQVETDAHLHDIVMAQMGWWLLVAPLVATALALLLWGCAPAGGWLFNYLLS